MNAIYGCHGVTSASVGTQGFIADAEVPGWRNKV